MILEDISASTVARAEVKTGTALVACCRAFFQTIRHSFATTTSDSLGHTLVVTAFRQDATNSGIWKKSKLAAMEVELYSQHAGICSQ